MPYLGALKAWIYHPVFAWWGVSSATIRLPAIAIAALTLWIMYAWLRGFVGKIWACVVVWLIALSPAYIFTSRLDWGPVVLMQFFKTSILLLAFRFAQTRSPWNIVGIVACCAAGFFDKFNFIWFVGASALAAVVCYFSEVRAFWARLPIVLRLVAAALAVVCTIAVTLIIYPLIELPDPALLWQRVQQSFSGTVQTLSGAAVAQFIFQTDQGIIRSVEFFTLQAALILAAVSLLPISRDPEVRAKFRAGRFSVLTMALIFAQIVVTPQAGGPHHFVMLFPFPYLALGFFGKGIADASKDTVFKRLWVGSLGAAAMFVLGANIWNTSFYIRKFQNASTHYNPRWSPMIDGVSAFLKQSGTGAARIVLVDWGLHNQIDAVSPEEMRDELVDEWPLFKDISTLPPESRRNTARSPFRAGKNLAVCFAEKNETFPETRRNFLEYTSGDDVSVRLLDTLNWNGEDVYEIYEVSRKESGR
ncbi:MAG TPA: glycosyltransferase family 39 protein [Chthoniobacterales bacterium]